MVQYWPMQILLLVTLCWAYSMNTVINDGPTNPLVGRILIYLHCANLVKLVHVITYIYLLISNVLLNYKKSHLKHLF